MKQRYYPPWLAAVFVVLAVTQLQAQKMDPATTKSLVDSKYYIFKAQSVSPMKGSLQQLTTDYDFTVAGDSVIAYLPYFGRAYSAPINTEGGINFTSAKSDYRVKQKKDRWEITIEPGDVPDIQQIYLDIYDNGSANLRVNSINRQPISYHGYIVEAKGKGRRAF